MALTYDDILRAQRAFQQQGNRNLLDRLYDQYGSDEVVRVAEEGPPAPTFLQRLQAGFATDPLSEAQIYQEQGVPASVEGDKVVYQTPQGMAPVDPEGFDFPGDIADWAGEGPATMPRAPRTSRVTSTPATGRRAKSSTRTVTWLTL